MGDSFLNRRRRLRAESQIVGFLIRHGGLPSYSNLQKLKKIANMRNYQLHLKNGGGWEIRTPAATYVALQV